MIKVLIKTSTLLALLLLAFGFSNAANADASYGTPPLCSGSGPGNLEAWVYTGLNYSGTCYSLKFDENYNEWTSWDVSTGFPNDQIQSVWLGNVTLVLFWNSLGTGDNGVPLHFSPGQFSSNLGGWNRKASAARVQLFPFGQCSGADVPDSRLTTVVLFTDQNFSSSNDCTVLVTTPGGSYPNPVAMGFRNDSMTSIINNSPYNAEFFGNCGFWSCNGVFTVPPYSSNPNVGDSFNDSLSEIDFVVPR